ncbi:hypothetical protein Tco_1097709 [Tanacetum coccineum]
MGVTLSGSQGLSRPQANGYVWLVQGGTTLGKDIIKSVDGCDDLPKIIKECGASESASVYVSSLHSQHHAHMYAVPTGRVKVPTGRYVVPTGKDNVIVSNYW